MVDLPCLSFFLRSRAFAFASFCWVGRSPGGSLVREERAKEQSASPVVVVILCSGAEELGHQVLVVLCCVCLGEENGQSFAKTSM